jgi:hypothetical protein
VDFLEVYGKYGKTFVKISGIIKKRQLIILSMIFE